MNDLMGVLYNPPVPKIQIGAEYTIRYQASSGGNGMIIKTKRMRCVAKYQHVILFENTKGVRECYTPWELARCIE